MTRPQPSSSCEYWFSRREPNPGNRRPPSPQSLGIWTAEDFLRGFRFVVAQKQSIQPKRVRKCLICSTNGGCDFDDTYEVQMGFDSSQFTPGLASITVTTPDGQHVETKFGLEKLK